MADDPRFRQETESGGDAFTTGTGDIHVHPPAPSPAPVPPEPKRIWGNVPARNPGFTGREPLLAAVRGALAKGDRVAVQALHGLGGVGKTQLAIEYAHLHKDSYDVVWWLNSENASLLGEQFAALAAELGCAPAGAQLDVMRRGVVSALHGRGRWLLIFDNAERPEDIAAWLPGGDGHVLITSRAHAWREVAAPVEVDVLSRAESAAMLRGQANGLSGSEAETVAAALGDLPLAVAQAAAFMADTGMPASDYVGLLRSRATEILKEGSPPTHPASLAAVVELAFDRLRDSDPPSAQVAAICAFAAPEPVPAGWFPPAAAELPEPLRGQACDAIAWGRLITRLRGSALVRVGDGTLLMHRLTQAIIRGHLSPDRSAEARRAALEVLIANHPGNEELPARWPAWARIMPHLLTLEAVRSDSTAGQRLAYDGAWYLLRRGDPGAARDLAVQLYDDRRRKLGEDHEKTLNAANTLAECLGVLKEYEAARALQKETLARCRRVLGEDHPATLASAGNLANDLHGLGEYGAARELDEETLARSRRVLGDDHPDTLLSGHNLANDLHGLGEYGAARELDEDTLARRRRVLGEDHPHTQESARNLTRDLTALGGG